MNVEKAQLELGETLRRLRIEAGYSTGKDFADAIGWQPSKVSRLENGRTLPASADITEWLASADAAPEIGERVRDQMRDIRLARDSWKRQLRHGHAGRQRVEAHSEQQAQRIVSVEVMLVPGLVQTADYARAVFAMAAAQHDTPPDTEDAVRERIRRQDVLYAADKQIEILVHELALRTPIAGPDVMRAQIDRVGSLIGLSHLRLGIIPLGTVVPNMTMTGYTIHDDTVRVEINHTEVVTDDPDDLATYLRVTDDLWSVAAAGEAARAILARLLG